MCKKYDVIEFTNGARIIVGASIIHNGEEYILANRLISDEWELKKNDELMIFEVLSDGVLLAIDDAALYGALFAKFMDVI